jgi:hypothetical protein
LQILFGFLPFVGYGGLNWCRDFDLWRMKKDAEWTLVGSKSKKSYAHAVRTPPKRTIFCQLQYPEITLIIL